MSDLHGENEAFVHILNSASGVIREKVDAVLGDTMPEAARAELATLIYYPARKLPLLKARYPEGFSEDRSIHRKELEEIKNKEGKING